ncbi:hypothetical protein POM88_053019 [Heracleum sosnowskyi]|uniref:Uncharacterized protein n=1 Tax=Heracleum sosnowskyi TaxID=360622 RepID=A0AAD8GR51_9APIA|nr:hypothetical protein POM88_053019 [Heracleum sosnowskyi]
MATRKQKGKGKGKVTASRESTNGGAGSSTRARGAGSSRAGGAGSSTRARVRTPSPSPPGSPASPPSTPPSPSSPRDPNRHAMTTVEERAWMGHKPRSNSMGKFGEKRPTKPTRVDIHGGRIFDDTAKKTLLAIMRDQWSVGLFTYTDVAAKNPRWMEDVLTEFGEMTKANKGKRPRRMQVWERTDTTSASRKAKEGNNGANLVYTSPGALAIASRYSAILEREGVDLSLGSEFIEPLDWWL